MFVAWLALGMTFMDFNNTFTVFPTQQRLEFANIPYTRNDASQKPSACESVVFSWSVCVGQNRAIGIGFLVAKKQPKPETDPVFISRVRIPVPHTGFFSSFRTLLLSSF